MKKNDDSQRRIKEFCVSFGIMAGIALIACLLGLCFAHFMHGLFSDLPERQPKPVAADYRTIPSQWIGYKQVAVYPLNVNEPTCFTAAEDGTLFVGNAEPPSLSLFTLDDRQPMGVVVCSLEFNEQPQCLAVGRSDSSFAKQILIGFSNKIELYSLEREIPEKRWSRPYQVAKISTDTELPTSSVWSIALSNDSIFAADSANGLIYRFNKDGDLEQSFGGKTATTASRSPINISNNESSGNENENGKKNQNALSIERFPGFVVYRSPITMTVSPQNGLLYVANPGLHRIEVFTQDGHWEAGLGFGQPSGAFDGFCGCCNPVGIDIFSDGRILTVEKSISRIKIFKPNGTLATVVAGPDLLESKPSNIITLRSLPNRSVTKNNDCPIMIAALPDARVLAFDPVLRIIRVLEPNKGSAHFQPR